MSLLLSSHLLLLYLELALLDFWIHHVNQVSNVLQKNTIKDASSDQNAVDHTWALYSLRAILGLLIISVRPA